MDCKQIKQLRKDLNLTQQQLADEIGYSREYLNYVERGLRPAGAKLINKLKKYFEYVNYLNSHQTLGTTGQNYEVLHKQNILLNTVCPDCKEKYEIK